MNTYAFWNNKGGTGKTSLSFQSVLAYSQANPNKKILVLDLFPQANLSELMLGGLLGEGSKNLHGLQNHKDRKTVGGYFQIRLPSPYKTPDFNPCDFIVTPCEYNKNIKTNISLLAGDPILEL